MPKHFIYTKLVVFLSIFIVVIIFFNTRSSNVSSSITQATPSNTILHETSNSFGSRNDFWWLNSGAKVSISSNIYKTIQGELPEADIWRKKYYDYNASETDDGYHPQNIFRLVTKQKYINPTQSMYFKINRYILSNDTHRSASNGVLFFHHYQDGDNLYYAGFRVDGYAVIKKKIKGKYFTLALNPVFLGDKYNRVTNPNLLPINTWIGIKTTIENIDSKTVSIKLFIDKSNTGNWQLVAEAKDDGSLYSGSAITNGGHAGIRSDFMDVEFRDYKLTEF